MTAGSILLQQIGVHGVATRGVGIVALIAEPHPLLVADGQQQGLDVAAPRDVGTLFKLDEGEEALVVGEALHIEHLQDLLHGTAEGAEYSHMTELLQHGGGKGEGAPLLIIEGDIVDGVIGIFVKVALPVSVEFNGGVVAEPVVLAHVVQVLQDGALADGALVEGILAGLDKLLAGGIGEVAEGAVDHAVADEGLFVGWHGAVFANNRLDSIQSFFPYIWDVEEYLHKFVPVNDLTPSDEVGWVDFWRIDTRACHVTWYIDPNMINDRIFGHGNELPENYICTPEDIPPRALMFFKFRHELYFRHWKKALLTNSPRFPVTLLTPFDRANEWVARSNKAA